jgi:hypothetical protein
MCKNDSKLHTIQKDVRFLALFQGKQWLTTNINAALQPR